MKKRIWAFLQKKKEGFLNATSLTSPTPQYSTVQSGTEPCKCCHKFELSLQCMNWLIHSKLFVLFLKTFCFLPPLSKKVQLTDSLDFNLIKVKKKWSIETSGPLIKFPSYRASLYTYKVHLKDKYRCTSTPGDMEDGFKYWTKRKKNGDFIMLVFIVLFKFICGCRFNLTEKNISMFSLCLHRFPFSPKTFSQFNVRY